jgi:hypothetical protein
MKVVQIDILTTSYWPHVELGKNVNCQLSKNKMTIFFELQFFLIASSLLRSQTTS